MLKDIIARITSAKTTVMGVITALLTVLVAVGVISQDGLTEGLSATGNLYDAILVILGSISSIALLFSKDSDVVERETIEAELEAIDEEDAS